MKLEIILKDGSSIFPAFDPEHKEAVIKFYREVFDKGLITGWKLIYS
jgi:hypothetical protein